MITRRGFRLGLAGTAAIALAVRVTYAVVGDPQVPEISDATAYHLLANNLADGRGYIRPFDLTLLGRVTPTAEYPPLFPSVVAVVALLGGQSVEVQRLAMCVVGTATVVVIGMLGSRAAGRWVGLLAAAIAAGYPMLFQSDAILMPETLFALLVAATLLLAYRAAEAPSLARFAALGAVIGLAGLTRAEGLLLAALVTVPVAWRVAGAERRRRLALGAVGLAATAAVVLPWTARNYIVFEQLVPVSNNVGTAVDGANCDATYAGRQKGLWLYSCFGGFDLTRQDEAEAAAFHRDRGLRYARDHAGEVPGVMAVRWLRTWGLHDTAQQVVVETYEGRTLGWQRFGLRMYWTLGVAAVAGTVVLIRDGRRVWPLVAPAVMVSVTAVLTYGNQRFRAGAEPSIVVLAATGIAATARAIRGRRRLRRSGGEVAGAAADGHGLPTARPGADAVGP